MDIPPITVVELPTFLRTAEAAGMTEAQRSTLVDFIARHPLVGDVIKDTGGLRKLRWQRAGAGKRGSYRAIYYFHDAGAPIYAFLVYGKNQQSDLTSAQRKSAAAMVDVIKNMMKAKYGGNK